MKKILVIEDDAVLSSTLVESLKEAGFEVLSALNGEEGLASALENKPDLILLDIILPKMNGIVMLKKLRQDEWGKKASVIILTNLNSPKDIADGIEWTEDYLVKSDWNIEDVIKHVKERVGR